METDLRSRQADTGFSQRNSGFNREVSGFNDRDAGFNVKDPESRMETVAVNLFKSKRITQEDNMQMEGNAREIDRVFAGITDTRDAQRERELKQEA